MPYTIPSYILRKLKLRSSEISSHPISGKMRMKGIMRYLSFNGWIWITKKMKYGWVGDLKFNVKRGEAGIVGNVYFGLDDFEDSGFLIHVLRHTDLFVDVGANLGHFSLLASGIKSCKSIAIEPVPSTFARLNELVQLNGLNELISTINAGVGEHEGELFFSTDRGTMNRIVAQSYPNKAKVPSRTLDQFLESKCPTLLKIDVEGFEYFVLQGSSKVLSNYTLKAIIIELNQSGKKYGVTDEAVIKVLQENGFKAFQYNPMSRRLTQLDGRGTTFNLIFIRDLEFVQRRCYESSDFVIWGVTV